MKFLLSFACVCAMALMMTTSNSMAADGPVRHVVSFRFKAGADPEKIHKVEEAFAALKTKIPQIESLEWGTNVSPEKHDKGFTHLWVLGFKTTADRDAYLVHPDHKAFGASLKDVIEDVFVIDFVPHS